MAVDYDLVIIGGSWAGVNAARKATQLQARVALVTQTDRGLIPNGAWWKASLSEVGHLNYQLANDPFAATEYQFPMISFMAANLWAMGINKVLEQQNSLASLAAEGVDVIVGRGEFIAKPQLALRVQERKLRSRYFLLAMGTISQPNFSRDSYLTVDDLFQQDWSNLEQDLIVVGSDPTALELAQTLARFSKQVTLVVEKSRILPQEDLDVVSLIQGQLEAEGVKIYTNSKVSQIKTIEQQQWLQAGDRALAADQIIFTEERQPNITGLNLAAVNVKYDQQRIFVNQRLQTTNPKIFACGDLIGGYNLPNITNYEINLILKNILLFPIYKTDYFALPWGMLTRPNFARVGWNEAQAKQRFGSDIYIIKEHVADIAQAQISQATTGICKLLVKTNGEIVGCSLFCDRAAELITIIALMIKHKVRLKSNPFNGLTDLSSPFIYPSMTEIIERASNNFYRQKLERNPRLRNRLRSWFSLRKSWH
ncbi:MAG: NAD(P)/FAD-dependent oxidoreductase [Cyanobacteria bacterium J06621_8]